MKIIILILFCLFVDKSFAETFGKETGLKTQDLFQQNLIVLI